MNINLVDIYFNRMTLHWHNWFQNEKYPKKLMAFYHQNNLICHRCTIYFEVYVRNHVCNNNSQSNPELKDGDISVINEINHQLCQNLIENFIKIGRLYSCKRKPFRRQYFSHINVITVNPITTKKFSKMNPNYVFHFVLKKKTCISFILFYFLVFL